MSLECAAAAVVSVLVIIVSSYYIYAKLYFSYWRKRNVPYAEPSFPFGNFKTFLTARNHLCITNDSLYKQMKGTKYFGAFIFHNPMFYVRDPELMKQILIKDFDNFRDRGVYYDETGDRDPLGANLFNMAGEKWKSLRAKLSGAFTSGKMKSMFSIISTSSNILAQVVDKEVEKSSHVDIKGFLRRYTIDIISSCAFGIEDKCLTNPNSYFFEMGNYLLESFSTFKGLQQITTVVFPNLAKILKPKFTDKKGDDFIINTISDTIKYREKNNASRNDILQMMIDMLKNDEEFVKDTSLQNGKDEKAKLSMTFHEIAAQAFIFFIAGFETSSSTTTFLLFEIARNPDIQKKVQEEIDRVMKKNGEQITYQAVMEVPYLDMVISETLRLYPVLPILNRMCKNRYQVPGTDIFLEPGTQVNIPIYSIQRDEEHFPDPLKFDPDRFTDENKKNRHPLLHIPFGDGPRICIGMRFAQLQMKAALLNLIYRYNFEVTSSEDLHFLPKNLIIVPDKDVILRLTKRKH